MPTTTTFVPDEGVLDFIQEMMKLHDPSHIAECFCDWGFKTTDFALVPRKILQQLIVHLKAQGFQIRATDRRHSLTSVLSEWVEGEWRKEEQEKARQAQQTQVQAQLKAQEQARQARQAQAKVEAEVQQQLKVLQAQVQTLQTQVQALQAQAKASKNQGYVHPEIAYRASTSASTFSLYENPGKKSDPKSWW